MAEDLPSSELAYLQERLGSRIIASDDSAVQASIVLSRDRLCDSLRLLKEDARLGLDFLVDITAVDYWQKKQPRFEVVYHLSGWKTRWRLRVKVPVPEADPAVESLTPLWAGANWLEREVWDLFGIRFVGHPDLRRILLYEEFEGYPLRKDYPVNLVQPRVAERKVAGTFVDERSRNKLMRLRETLGGKKQ